MAEFHEAVACVGSTASQSSALHVQAQAASFDAPYDVWLISNLNSAGGHPVPRIYAVVLLVFSFFAGGILSMVCFAAPVMPKKQLPDPILSLAGVKEVRVGITPVSHELREHDITKAFIRTTIETLLTERGIAIVEHENAPKLELMSIAVVEPTVPDATAFNMRLLFYQRTHVERLDRALVVPTFSDFNVSIDRNEKLKETAILTLEQLLSRFADKLDMATRVLRPTSTTAEPGVPAEGAASPMPPAPNDPHANPAP